MMTRDLVLRISEQDPVTSFNNSSDSPFKEPYIYNPPVILKLLPVVIFDPSDIRYTNASK